MLNCLVRNVSFPGKDKTYDIAIHQGVIREIDSSITAEAAKELDAGGNLVVPPFVDSHFHLDAALSLGLPRFNQSGTLLEGIEIWNELKPDLKAEQVKQRAMEMLRWSIARGTLAVRTHVDVTDPSLLALDVLLEVKDEMKNWVDLQLVAFPQDGLLRTKEGKELMVRALEKGVEVVGGIPHFERTAEEGRKSISWLCSLAESHGLLVDIHCDETDDPNSRHIEHLTYETLRMGLGERVAASHLTSMHSMDNYYVSKLLPLMAESSIQAICNPLINIHLQGRHDTYPKRRGLTRVPELLNAGVNVAFGHDCVMDPWYPMGSHDMLEVAHMGGHCLQMMGTEQMNLLLEMVTTRGAEVLNLERYGIAVGNPADFVVLQAKSVMDALRLQPVRLFVFRRGEVVASTPPSTSTLNLGGETSSVDFHLKR
ncbi:cytosine deaminase [Desulfopila sp. IMCC35008]|uniref:cytosine deaminase n=1 Tax=Desulfopila sp. IMCC35008 TaxID=2653858 RepID=UPI0013D751D3|nr:cytosine deaminase [Desulfopila sp. IMCC35008]